MAYNGPMILPLWTFALVMSLSLSLVGAWAMTSWAPRWGLIDAHDARKSHRGDVPVGGLAVIVASLTAFGPSLVVDPSLAWWMGGALLVGLVGLADDRRSLAPLLKLGVQTVAAALALQGGPFIGGMSVFGLDLGLGALSGPLLVIWIVGLTNAFNLTDGLDGLACGAAIVLALAATTMSAVAQDGVTLALAVTLGGAAVGFLPFNAHPARLFLGDGGSYALGFLLALATLRAAQPDGTGTMPLGALALLWGYPLVDTGWAIVRRLSERRPIFEPDRAHLHHQLLERLGRYRATVFGLYGLFLVLAALGLGLWALGH